MVLNLFTAYSSHYSRWPLVSIYTLLILLSALAITVWAGTFVFWSPRRKCVLWQEEHACVKSRWVSFDISVVIFQSFQQKNSERLALKEQASTTSNFTVGSRTLKLVTNASESSSQCPQYWPAPTRMLLFQELWILMRPSSTRQRHLLIVGLMATYAED